MKRALRLLAPYMAVGIFWCGFSNGWLAILAYHAQILFWSQTSWLKLKNPVPRRLMLLALPTVTAGPLLYFLLPHITHVDLGVWLERFHLRHLAFLLMIPYFGLLHPLLEQVHWTPLRKETPFAHLFFAGYHMLVLYSLLTIPWLIACFVILATASVFWQQVTKWSQSITVSVTSHVLADLGVILAAWLKI